VARAFPEVLVDHAGGEGDEVGGLGLDEKGRCL